MSFFSTAATAIRVARECEDAWEAALEAIEHERPLPEVIRAFASKTDSQIDDHAADVLIEGLTKAIDIATMAVQFASAAAPKIAEWGVQALVWEQRLKAMRG